MKKLFEIMAESLTKDEDVVLVTVIAGSGSTPRGAGARMLVKKNGYTYGTIGGGAVEYKAQQLAAEVLNEKKSFTKGFNLVPNQVADLGMICGGNVVVYFQYIKGKNKDMINLCEIVKKQFNEGKDTWLITDITDETAWGMGIYSENTSLKGIEIEDMSDLLGSKAVQVNVNSKRYYSEQIVNSGIVYIFGGGHVAQELVPVISHIGFRCVVIDDREEFANPKLFPKAYDTIACDYKDFFINTKIKQSDYIAIMTRGHQYDLVIQMEALRTEACYIGVMGSKTKIKALSKKILENGFSDEDIKRFRTPIGTDIKAETPGEIAISIAGELIETRAIRKAKRG